LQDLISRSMALSDKSPRLGQSPSTPPVTDARGNRQSAGAAAQSPEGAFEH